MLGAVVDTGEAVDEPGSGDGIWLGYTLGVSVSNFEGILLGVSVGGFNFKK